MKGSRIILFVTANLVDEARLKNFVHMMRSIQGPFHHLYLSYHLSKELPLDMVQLLKDVAGKSWTACQFQTFKPHFWQLEYMVRNKCKDVSDDYWCLFTHDDGLWHPLRVQVYEDHVRALSNEQSDKVSCIMTPEHTTWKTPKDVPLSCAEDVSAALSRGDLLISCREPGAGVLYELYNICIPLHVLREFFQQTDKEVWCNAYAEVCLCDWLMEYRHQEGFRTIQFKVKEWTYMWRRAEASYTVLSGSQMGAARFYAKTPYELVLYMDIIAQMASVVSMRATAKELFDNLTRRQPVDIVAMLQDKLERVSKEKPWVIK